MGKGEYDNQAYPNYPPAGKDPYAAPGYAQPGYGQPPVTNQPVIVQQKMGGQAGVSPTTMIVQQQEVRPNFGGHIAFACVVFWCCCPLFGAISFFIAICGINAASVSEAKGLGRSSMGLSIAGLVLGVIGGVIFLALWFTVLAVTPTPTYTYCLDDYPYTCY